MKMHRLGIIGAGLLAGMLLLATCGWESPEKRDNSTVYPPVQPGFYGVSIPDSMVFMGDPVPLSQWHVRESLERELLVNAHFHSQTIRLIKLADRYFSIIDPILAEMGIPADFRYLAVAESGLNPKALSPAGAAGIWQFVRAAASDYGLEVSAEVDERYHIEKSTRAAARYLSAAYLKYNDWALVAAAYNAGRSALDRHMTRQKVNSYYDLLLAEETERYVFRILALKLILENPGAYGFYIAEADRYPKFKTRKVEVSATVANLADFSIEQGTNYKMLKYFNPWLRENALTVRSGRTYIIELPAE